MAQEVSLTPTYHQPRRRHLLELTEDIGVVALHAHALQDGHAERELGAEREVGRQVLLGLLLGVTSATVRVSL